VYPERMYMAENSELGQDGGRISRCAMLRHVIIQTWEGGPDRGNFPPNEIWRRNLAAHSSAELEFVRPTLFVTPPTHGVEKPPVANFHAAIGREVRNEGGM
jgi:hypothetical protein